MQSIPFQGDTHEISSSQGRLCAVHASLQGDMRWIQSFVSDCTPVVLIHCLRDDCVPAKHTTHQEGMKITPLESSTQGRLYAVHASLQGGMIIRQRLSPQGRLYAVHASLQGGMIESLKNHREDCVQCMHLFKLVRLSCAINLIGLNTIRTQ